MDFLLECIGFPPECDLSEIITHVRAVGEPTAWRGPAQQHLRLALTEGLELRVDQDPGEDFWTVWPFYSSPHRLRVAVHELRPAPESHYDALLLGTGNPPVPGSPVGDSYPFSTWLTDARRVPRKLDPGHVLAISAAGFALDVTFVGPSELARHQEARERPQGAALRALGGASDPDGCMEVSLRVRELKRIRNPLTGMEVDLVEADAPGRPLRLFVSRWQLEESGLPPLRSGWRLEGTFVFTGRIAGGLPPARPKKRQSFG